VRSGGVKDRHPRSECVKAKSSQTNQETRQKNEVENKCRNFCTAKNKSKERIGKKRPCISTMKTERREGDLRKNKGENTTAKKKK